MDDFIRRQDAISLYEDEDIDMSALKVPVPVIIQNLKDFPAADVREVAHGEWTDHRTIEHDGEFYCSNCGFELESFVEGIFYNYCPNCGALMDKDGDGD